MVQRNLIAPDFPETCSQPEEPPYHLSSQQNGTFHLDLGERSSRLKGATDVVDLYFRLDCLNCLWPRDCYYSHVVDPVDG